MAYDSTNFDRVKVEPAKPRQQILRAPVVQPEPSDPIERTLRRARDLILEKGWGQGKFFETTNDGEHQNYCIMGALRDSINSYDGYWSTHDGAKDLLTKCIPFPANLICSDPMSYNDHFAKKEERVIRLFDKAIKRRVKQLAKEQ